MVIQNDMIVGKHDFFYSGNSIEEDETSNNSLPSNNWPKSSIHFDWCCETVDQSNTTPLYVNFITEWSVPILHKERQTITYNFVVDWS